MEYKNLSNEELISLYTENGNEDIKEYFFERNLKFAYSFANKFIKTHKDKNDHEDIESESVKGMLKAFNTFDVDKGNKFTSYAGMVIHNEILLFLRNYRKVNKVKFKSIYDVLIDLGENELTIEDTLCSDNVRFDTYLLANEAMDKFNNIASDREKHVYDLVIRQDIHQYDVANMLGIHQSGVSKIMKRVRSKLAM